MSPTELLFFAVTLWTVDASEFKKYLSEFNDHNELLSLGVSPQCVADMAVFGASLSEYAATLASCVRSGACTDEQKQILEKDMFAVKQIDSFGKLPAGILEMTMVSSGSYVECRDLTAPYKTHYCYADIAIKNMTNSLIGSMGMNVATCMPKSCSEKDITLLLTTIFNKQVVPLEFPSAKCVPTSVKPTTAFWIFMSFVAFFVTWAILASVADYFLDKHHQSEGIKNMTVIRLFLTFSFYTNASLLLDTGTPKEGNLRSLASIRFISMTWVAVGHTLGTNAMSSDALLPVLSLWNPLLSTAFTNAFLSVDTFFLLSGILVAYLFFKARPPSKRVKSPFTWILFYVHRYLRLTPPMMIFIGLYTVMLPFTNGPWTASNAGNRMNTYEEACQKYWWRNMLYINNFFGMENECYGISWYLAVDTQLYVAAPLFLITLYISPIIGGVVLILFCAASVAFTYAITYRDDLPALVLGAFAFAKTSVFFDEFYEKPWTRCPPYLIGIGVGYILAQMKNRKPKLHWVPIVAGWIVAASVAVLSVYGPHEYIKGHDDWSVFVRASYNNFSRIGWSLAVSWVIVANHLGWGGLISKFMDHPIWQPLGRLSYCAYIVHFYIIQYIFNLDDRPAHYVSIWQTYVYRGIPVIVLSYMLAFVWSCLFEVPTTKLEKMLFEGLIPRRKPHSADAKASQSTMDNGVYRKKSEDLPL
ncbi:Acyltransferase [Trichostrongylus colubriformis]|uniref:Acyltransferase n=1 Tax=Trichostrongylus colubriformis TaxID=6319 RepID=A0AAN8ITQ3_TRICO